MGEVGHLATQRRPFPPERVFHPRGRRALRGDRLLLRGQPREDGRQLRLVRGLRRRRVVVVSPGGLPRGSFARRDQLLVLLLPAVGGLLHTGAVGAQRGGFPRGRAEGGVFFLLLRGRRR